MDLMEPFDSCSGDYRVFKDRYKKVLKKLSMKRDNDVEELLYRIWEFSNMRFKEGYDQRLRLERVYKETTKEEPKEDYVGPILLEDDYEV